MSEHVMRVKIKQNENGEHYFIIPDEFQKDLSWNEGDLIEWIDNGDSCWTLKKLCQQDALEPKAIENSGLKSDYSNQIKR